MEEGCQVRLWRLAGAPHAWLSVPCVEFYFSLIVMEATLQGAF